MGGDKVPTPFDKWVGLFEAERGGEIKVGWGMDGMHVKVKRGESLWRLQSSGLAPPPPNSHPCDPCISREDFNSEKCDGCDKEMEQVTYVPPRLRRRV